ncbi:hypothetical protein CEXT_266781 [Caerostris extrusa]|uniref:Uncharacterized protein n=1 Tax=Caerostris extrusa TaxID=172846 RepID=A0AAV4WJW4_CAEEX|nr:hypothetical protein CEXT_266781 [Caerostris extrusa]
MERQDGSNRQKKRYRWEAPVKINLYPRPTTSNPVFKRGVLSGDLDMRVVHQQGYFFITIIFLLCLCVVPIYLNSSIETLTQAAVFI